jgi:Fibronectin type-III domain
VHGSLADLNLKITGTFVISNLNNAPPTTAAIKNAEGGPLLNGDGTIGGPFDYGSGHVRPIHAADPGLVYEASYEDYLLFTCASAGVQMDYYYPCPKNPPQPYALNYPSIAVSRLNDTVSVIRTVTNVGNGSAQYQVSIVNPDGASVHISPRELKFKNVGEKKSFKVILKNSGNVMQRNGTYVAGSYTWSDGVHFVRSTIVVSFV